MLAAGCERAAGQTVNVACGEKATLNELYAKLEELIDSGIQPIHDDPRPGDVKHSLADISMARELLGYETIVSFDEGIERTVDWYRSREGS